MGNDYTVISSPYPATPKQIKPLSSQRSMNSLNRLDYEKKSDDYERLSRSPSPKKNLRKNIKDQTDILEPEIDSTGLDTQYNSPKSPRFQSPLKRFSSPKKSYDSPKSATPSYLQSDYNRLERQYTDLIIKYNNLNHDFQTLQYDLSSKTITNQEDSQKIKNLQSYIKLIQEEFNHDKILLTQQIKLNENTIFDLNLKIKKLSSANDNYEESTFNDDHFQLTAKFDKLSHDYKILKSNHELEQSSKKFLIDQIDNLNLQIESLKSNELDLEFDNDQSVIHHLVEHTMNQLTDDEDEDEILQNSTVEDFAQNSTQDLVQNATIEDISQDSFHINTSFSFPNESKKLKHQSLPAQLKDDFVLSPLKLAMNLLYFETDQESVRHIPPTTVKRYSKGHSRYNSHDIVPIQVEFEPMEARSTSEYQLQKPIEEDDEEEPDERTNAFNKLNGEILAPIPPQSSSSITNFRNSIIGGDDLRDSLISSSSQRSSLIEEPMKKQEIMKLKFELQSLKLQNEKLLSYIGFEMQKQNLNIAELAKTIEYSDSKLIEKSREELIHKKRVLRSVSINSILSKNYNNPISSSSIILGKAVLQNFEYQEEEDDYGFLNENDQFPNRIFSRGLQKYYNDNIEEENSTNKSLKNHKSLKNIRYNYEIDDDNIIEESHESSFDESIVDDIEEFHESSFYQSSSEDELGLIDQFKHMILGSNKSKYMKNEELVDDRLKYKFVAITLGIMIIGLKFSHQNLQQQLS